MKNYDDIIELPHHVSTTRQPMSMEGRAAQFSSFAALNGHDEALCETARITSQQIELTPDQQARLSRLITSSLNKGDKAPLLRITYFKPDPLKQGGEYISVVGRIRRVETAIDQCILTDGTELLLSSIISIRPSTPDQE